MYAQTCEELADYIRKDANYSAGDCRGLVDAMASEREQRMTPTSMPLPTSMDLTLRFCAAARHDGSERHCFVLLVEAFRVILVLELQNRRLRSGA